MARVLRLTGTLILMILVNACAGPMSPFGAIERFTSSNLSTDVEGPSTPLHVLDNPAAEVNFKPDRQNWHNAATFQIQITDLQGILPTHRLHIYYNDRDITDVFLKNSEIFINSDNTVMRMQLNDMRLLPDRENEIVVSYQRDAFTKKVVSFYEQPDCHMEQLNTVRNPASFSEHHAIIRTLERVALNEGINPSFLAGLVAQESSFDPKAVSYAKAIGLTQITDLAQEQILGQFNQWPTYPELSKMNVASIKALIGLGHINHQNEWRLDVEKSLRGGIRYLDFIENYWRRDVHFRKVKGHYEDHSDAFFDLVLASYNSGPYRVKKALDKYGTHWLKSPQLKEARRYVGRVKSYCYHFSHDSYRSNL